MGSAARFWPKGLFQRGTKNDAQTGFVPTTDIAARIIGSKTVDTAPVAEAPPTSFDDLSFPVSSEPPALIPDVDADISRQAERFVPDKTSTTLTDRRGKAIRARIMNLSATGVAIEADFRIMPADTVSFVGAKPVKPGRSIRGGQVFLFDKPLDPARCNKQIVL